VEVELGERVDGELELGAVLLFEHASVLLRMNSLQLADQDLLRTDLRLALGVVLVVVLDQERLDLVVAVRLRVLPGDQLVGHVLDVQVLRLPLGVVRGLRGSYQSVDVVNWQERRRVLLLGGHPLGKELLLLLEP